MANDIGAYFHAEPDRAAAVSGIVNHLKRFWDPRMRKKIIAHYESGATGLSELANEAIGQLAKQ
jgi:formate dehydrogenase subunit delta